MQENLDEFENERTFIKVFDDILDDPELDVIDAYIYGIIYSFNSRGRKCCYSQGNLAKKIKIGRTTLNKRINKLVEKGFLQVSEFLPGGIIRYKIT
jgi:hypothetical protein